MVTPFYQYPFTSPEPIYGTIREEFKSYFDTSAIDELLFPVWVDKCLKKLGRSTLPIRSQHLHISDFTCRLPDDFRGVREVWILTEEHSVKSPSPNSFYSQTPDPTTILVSPVITDQAREEIPEVIQSVYKTNLETSRAYRRKYLLKPATLEASSISDSPKEGAPDVFDIRDNRLVVKFRTGLVELLYYAEESDCEGSQLIPDNYRIREYIEAFLKYKCMESLSNTLIDETFQQIQQKLQYYKQLSDEAYILADIETKKQTVWQKQAQIKRTLKRNRIYEISNRTPWRNR